MEIFFFFIKFLPRSLEKHTEMFKIFENSCQTITQLAESKNTHLDLFSPHSLEKDIYKVI